MTQYILPHSAVLMVGDGRKALLLRNEGTPDQVDLVVIKAFSQISPSTADQGESAPGRTFSSSSVDRRSAYETTDWHDLAEHEFGKTIASELERVRAEGGLKKLIVVAPPRALADIRKAMTAATQECLIAEVDKDLTKHSIPKITEILFGKAALKSKH
jgi:protein required for attachment to host cells